MSKQSSKKDAETKARRRLARARTALLAAQEADAQARERGERALEKARLRATRWTTRSSQRVQARTEAVARAEERLRKASPSPAGQLVTPDQETPEPVPTTPEATADLIAQHETEAPAPVVGAPAMVANTPEIAADLIAQRETEKLDLESSSNGLILPETIEPRHEDVAPGNEPG